ncbi:FIGNL1-interacting regulator of recombination and mitosis-like isoform X2 [Bombus pascuorum]|uniref:FIGNL1-interacting regulator of recombination and mitosis-like isoform X2 n=2 Tax=Bombus pascuorum TaxID=65598 RepID=UPI002146DFDD|nr:FIGNL1-interacting regulator of recombination and mitosis-like isoform X2 [Bombus pascuorum]
MASETSFTALLEDSFSDNDNSTEDYSSNLKDALEKLTERYDTELLRQALQQSLSSCSDNLLAERIFNEILPFAYYLLSEALKKIEGTINTNADGHTVEDAKRQLIVCHELLSVWEKSMERVSKLCKPSAIGLKCTVENVLLTIRLIFEHCRASKKLYSTLFEDVSQELTNLFRKAKTILNLFLATLENVIVFDTDTESETELLVKVIDSIGSFVTISRELDLKTFVETSKIFGKLAITNQHHVKRTNVMNITLQLIQFTKDVSSMLVFCQDSSDRVEERTIKVIGHSLKILDRLFAAYSSHINNEILPFVIELLLKMHRCSPLCLQNSQIDSKLIDVINIQISKGSEPFLNTVFKSPDFKQAFFDYRNQANVDNLGYHLLTVNIMKKLIYIPYEQHCKWTLGTESIIDVTLSNINHLQEEICVGQVRLPGVHDIGERSRSASIYEATIVPICGLISQIPADGFHAVELILLKHLLSNQLWSSLLSSDIWCFIGRIGSLELCASHVKYLLNVYAVLMKRSNSLEIVMLENLIGRLYNLLPEETKHTVITELDDLENPCWLAVARFLPPRTKAFLQNRLACVLNEIPRLFTELQRQPTVQNWNRITILLSLIGKLNCTKEKNTINILSQIWNSIASTIEIFEGKQLDMLSEFISKLLSATQPEKIQDDTFFSILEAILASLLCFPPRVKAIASYYLRNSIDSFDNCGIKTVNALAELNCRLLEDENPWVRQEAFESFDYLAHMCPNEDLVTKMAAAVTRKSSLRDSLPAYLSGTIYYELQDFSNIRDYLKHMAKHSQNVYHVCNNYEDCQRDQKLAKLENESIESFDENSPLNHLDEHVSEICDELNDILKKSSDIANHVMRRLRLICMKILDLTESK